jgi:hypothetical protein
LVRFRFFKPRTEKLNRTEPESKKTETNLFEPVFVLKNQTEPN